MFLGQESKTIEYLIEPSRYAFDGVGAYSALGISLITMLVGLGIVFLLIRKLGKPTGSINAETAILGLPVAVAVFILPGALLLLAVGDQANNYPIQIGMLQILATLIGIGVLFWNPYNPAPKFNTSGAPIVPSWLKFKPKWLLIVPGIWLLSYFAIQGAMFASVSIAAILDVDAGIQPQLESLHNDDSSGWIAGWYVRAAVAAPLSEELAFRMITFGGLTYLLTSLTSKSSGASVQTPTNFALVAATILSTILFVLAHGGWAVGFLPLTVLSLILTGLYAYSGSIWPPVLFHALHNGLVVTLQFFYLTN